MSCRGFRGGFILISAVAARSRVSASFCCSVDAAGRVLSCGSLVSSLTLKRPVLILTRDWVFRLENYLKKLFRRAFKKNYQKICSKAQRI